MEFRVDIYKTLKTTMYVTAPNKEEAIGVAKFNFYRDKSIADEMETESYRLSVKPIKGDC